LAASPIATPQGQDAHAGSPSLQKHFAWRDFLAINKALDHRS